MRHAGSRVVLSGILLALMAAPAWAGDGPSAGAVSEVRLGGYFHDVGGSERGGDVAAELLFVSPAPQTFGDFAPPWLRWAFQPRPHLGLDINTSGYTSQAYLGLTWTATLSGAILGRSDALFASFDFGPSLNDGHVRGGGSRYENLGSNVLLRLGFDLGYQVTPRVSIMGSFNHESSAGLAHDNEGLNSAGVRLGIRF